MGYGSYVYGSGATVEDGLNKIDEVLQTCGLARTSDTGQWDGVSSLGNGDYLVYRFNDALQAGSPIFIKITKISGAFQFVFGTGSDGSGGITGDTNSSSSGAYYLTFPSSTLYYCFDNGGFFLTHLDSAKTSFGITLWVERARTLTGEPKAGSFVSFGSVGRAISGELYTQYNMVFGSATAPITIQATPGGIKGWRVNALISQVLSTSPVNPSADGSVAPLQPIYFFGPGGGWYSNLLIHGYPTEVGTVALNAVVNGTSRTYKLQTTAINSSPESNHKSLASGVSSTSTLTSCCPLMLWQ